MDFFDKWHPAVRWIGFIPVYFITYYIIYLLQSFSLTFVLGPYDESSFFNYMIYRAYFDIVCTGVAIYACARCIPKGRVIVACACGAIFFILAGFTFAVTFMYGTELPVWKVIFSFITCAIGTVGAIVATFMDEKDKKRNEQQEQYLEY